MKLLVRPLVLLLTVFSLVLVSVTNPISAQISSASSDDFRSSFGKEFWTSFGRTLDNATTSLKFTITVSALQDATVDIYWPNLDGSTTTKETLNVTAGTTVTSSQKDSSSILVHKHEVTSTTIIPDQLILKSGVRIVADTPISAYASTFTTADTESTLLYPVNYIGTDYRIVTPSWGPQRSITVGSTNYSNTDFWDRPATANEKELWDRFQVTAIEDNTVVTINPKDDIPAARSGAYPQLNANTDNTITLQAGETYVALLDNDAKHSVSGTKITATKKVVVQSSASFVGRNFADIIIEQQAPVDTWGKSFIVPMILNSARTSDANSDLFFIVADEDATIVTINGTAQSPINAGDSILHQPAFNSVADVITADKPIAIMQIVDYGTISGTPTFQIGTSDTPQSPNLSRGDPASVMLVPTEQALNDMVFSTAGTGMNVFTFTVVAKKTDVANVKINGNFVGNSNFTDVGSSDYAVARLPIRNNAPSNVRVQSTDGVIVYSYGFGSAQGHAFSASTGLVDLTQNPGGTADTGFKTLEQVTTTLNAPPPPTSSSPAPYTGPLVTSVGDTSVAGAFQTFSGQTVRVNGERLAGVTKVFVDGLEATLVSTANDHFVMVLPNGITDGVHDLVIQSSLGNLRYLDGLRINSSLQASVNADNSCAGQTTVWTKRISDTQAKAYIKCPEIGKKYRIMQQVAGAGAYQSVFVKTINSLDDSSLVVNEFGTYIVRTIDLEDINRIRIRVDSEDVWKVRYNN